MLKNTQDQNKDLVSQDGNGGGLKGLQTMVLDNVLREVVPEGGSVRIEGSLAQGQATERRNYSRGVHVTE